MRQREAVGAKTLRSHRAWHGRARAQGERSGMSRASNDTTFSDVNGTAAERKGTLLIALCSLRWGSR